MNLILVRWTHLHPPVFRRITKLRFNNTRQTEWEREAQEFPFIKTSQYSYFSIRYHPDSKHIRMLFTFLSEMLLTSGKILRMKFIFNDFYYNQSFSIVRERERDRKKVEDDGRVEQREENKNCDYFVCKQTVLPITEQSNGFVHGRYLNCWE